MSIPRPLDFGSIHPDLVNYQKVPFLAESVSPLQLIKKVTDQKVVESLWTLFHFLVPSVSFLTLVLVGCLLYWLVLLLFSRFKISTGQQPSRKNLQTKITAFFFLCFFFFMGQLFEACLNTSSIVVRTDQLLYSKKQILETRKEFCFWEKGSEMDFLEKVRSMKSDRLQCKPLCRIWSG